MKIIIPILLIFTGFYSGSGLSLPKANDFLEQKINQLNIENSLMDLEIEDPELRSKADIIIPWLRYSAHAVKTYYGKFPVEKYRLQLIAIDGDSVTSGHAYGGSHPLIEVYIGKQITPENLKKDWVLVHEMIHLALAELPRRHHWLVEGLAVYIESVARVKAGQLQQDVVWKSFIKSMPKGLPQQGDKGLDFTPTWGRRYWGGALFCLLADIQIRQDSNNQFGLLDAMRGILDAGYSMNRESDIESLLKLGDQATGLTVLIDQYDQMKAQPVTTDLDQIWRSVGVSLLKGKIKYNDKALLAKARLNIFKPVK